MSTVVYISVLRVNHQHYPLIALVTFIQGMVNVDVLICHIIHAHTWVFHDICRFHSLNPVIEMGTVAKFTINVNANCTKSKIGD